MFYRRLLLLSIIPVAVLTAVAIFASVAAAERDAQTGTSTTEAVLGFADVLSDEAVSDLLSRHDVQATGIFIWVSGMSGSHRVYPGDHDFDAPAPEWLADARGAAQDFFDKALDGNAARVAAFVTENPLAIVADHSPPVAELRSLLAIRTRLSDARSHLLADDPVIYGLIVRGPAAHVDAAASDPRVKERADSMRAAGDARPARPTKPPRAERYQQAADQPASAADLYAAAASIGVER